MTPREALEQFRPLAERLARSLQKRLPRVILFDDIYAASIEGLWQSALKHSSLPPNEFEAYSIVRIRGAILDEVRRQNHGSRYAHREGKEVSFLWLDGLPIEFAESAIRVESTAERDVLALELVGAVSRLPKRHRSIVTALLRGETQAEISRRLRLTQARMSQIIAEAVVMLRKIWRE